MSSQTCKIFWVLCLLANAFECWANGEAHCDCKRLDEMVDAHTKRLSALVSYERKTERLMEFQKKLTISNYEEHNRDVTQKLKDIDDFIAEVKIRTKKLEDELAEYRNITQKLDSWIEESNTTIADVVKSTLQSTTFASDVEMIRTTPKPTGVEALPERIRLRQTPEQTIFEQMKLMMANLTTEMAVIRNYRLPRLESKVAVIEARLPVN
ncbi:hypothetical protein GHT06_015881 [Daphnia sinensis]|uniref:Uncharacterized protein n=1 Tax=Daphnia sinensis TaxID=1820382 RepID=A0AAD5KRS4_9CRUS|nr:hypothetical protein GHT06_015881 [Daphnia sinensis]